MKKVLSILLCLLAVVAMRAQESQHNPYSDDRLLHFGFGIGMNFMSFAAPTVEDFIAPVGSNEVPTTGRWTDTPVNPGEATFGGKRIQTRVSSIIPGLTLTLNADVRLCKYLNLRFAPGLMFAERRLTYTTVEKNKEDQQKTTYGITSLPLVIPVYLKYSSERQGNWRPYLIAGGGVSYELYPEAGNPERVMTIKPLDYFCEVGVGADVYLPWFRLSPELKYHIGFADVLMHAEERNVEMINGYEWYTKALQRLTSQMITLVFNFESR